MNRTIVTVNPATGEELAAYTPMSLDDATRVAKDARSTFEKWRRAPLAERADHLLGLAKVLRNKKNEYARLMTSEMGKPNHPGRSGSGEMRLDRRSLCP